MNLSHFITNNFKKLIPSPFTLAVLLSIFVLLVAFLFTGQQNATSAATILDAWQKGMWDPSLLVFMVQMMLILVLGHILVLSLPVSRFINFLIKGVSGNSSAVIIVSVSTMLVAFFNWGLGLIFGAIMARKVAETAREREFKINYPLLGAAGYVGLIVWHGGMSGSAPLKVAEKGHLANLFPSASSEFLAALPHNIPTTATIFSTENLIVFGSLLIAIPLALYAVARKSGSEIPELDSEITNFEDKINTEGAERLDHSEWLKTGFGCLLLAAFFASYSEEIFTANLTPNMLNFFMLGLGIVMHRSFSSFLKALKKAIIGAAAILIQFPLYFGIMGVMRDTELITEISNFFVSISTETTLPLFSFLSAGLVNIFVPSGGGQWAIQGPIIIESALKLGVPPEKMVLALAYGDQITNMLQPFWALPLLAITKLKARDILPYTLVLLLVGSVVYITALLII